MPYLIKNKIIKLNKNTSFSFPVFFTFLTPFQFPIRYDGLDIHFLFLLGLQCIQYQSCNQASRQFLVSNPRIKDRAPPYFFCLRFQYPFHTSSGALRCTWT